MNKWDRIKDVSEKSLNLIESEDELNHRSGQERTNDNKAHTNNHCIDQQKGAASKSPNFAKRNERA